MDQHVAQVVPPRVHSTERIVEAQRHPGERDVVAHQRRGPHPAELGPTKPPEVPVREEVDVVVPVEELSRERGQEGDEGDDEEQAGESALQNLHATLPTRRALLLFRSSARTGARSRSCRPLPRMRESSTASVVRSVRDINAPSRTFLPLQAAPGLVDGWLRSPGYSTTSPC